MARAATQVPVGRVGDGGRCEIRSTSDMARGPMCSMAVFAQTPLQFVFDGTTYHFCSAGCREEFAAAPEQFLELALALSGASAMDAAVIRKEESP